jgi:hypothetical protein
MSGSLYLFTAACLAAAPPDAPPLRPVPAQTIEVTPAEATPPPPPGLFGRIRNFFTGRRSDPVVPAGGARLGTTVSPEGDIGRMHLQSGGMTQMGTPTTVKSSLGLPANDRDLDKVGHEKDHSWITGKLYRVQGGRWVLRYAGPGEVDPYQGAVLLAPRPDLANFRDGDLVCIHGRVIGGRAQPLAGAVYEAREINAVGQPRR